MDEHEIKWMAAIIVGVAIPLSICAAIVGSFRAETETAAVKAGLVQTVREGHVIWVERGDDQ